MKSLILLLTALAVLFASSCTTYRPVKLQDASTTIGVQARMRVTTKDGTQESFHVVDCDAASITIPEQRFEYADLQKLELNSFDPSKSYWFL